MSSRGLAGEMLSKCSLESLLDEALRRLYERRSEIDGLLRELEQQKRQASDRTLRPIFNPAIREESLRLAIARDQFVVYYQPKLSLRLRQLVGFEAVVHWNHPQLGLIPPAEFIPSVEAAGLAAPLGSLILSQACRQLALWRQEISRAAFLTMDIKLLQSQLESEDTTEQVKKCFTKFKLPPSALRLALTEPSLKLNPELALRLVEELSRLHVQVWLDDLTISSYPQSQLHRYPLSGLKIDSSFLVHRDRPKSVVMTSAISTLSRNLGLQIAVEGIETAEEADELERLGCEFGQGTLFSKPVPAGAATRFILADSFGLLGRSKHGPRQLSNSLDFPPPLLA